MKKHWLLARSDNLEQSVCARVVDLRRRFRLSLPPPVVEDNRHRLPKERGFNYGRDLALVDHAEYSGGEKS